MSFEELDHTADYMFRCKGLSLEELFSESARAMFSIMFENNDSNTACVTKKIELESDSISNLLIDFLSELIFVAEVDCLVLSGVNLRITGNSLKAEIFGEPFVLERHSGGTEIKGISRSGVKITEINENNTKYYRADIIFDV